MPTFVIAHIENIFERMPLSLSLSLSRLSFLNSVETEPPSKQQQQKLSTSSTSTHNTQKRL